VLHLARRITFGMDIGNFLQLQSAFERDRIIEVPAQIKEIGLAEQTLRDLFDFPRLVERFADGERQMRQAFQERPKKILGNRPFALTEVKR